MELAFIVYLISILEGIKGWLMFLTFVFGIAFLSLAIIQLGMYADGQSEKVWKKSLAGLFVTFLLLSGINALLPDEKQAYTIAAAYAGQKIAENEKVQEIGGKVVTLLNQKLDNAIKEEKK